MVFVGGHLSEMTGYDHFVYGNEISALLKELAGTSPFLCLPFCEDPEIRYHWRSREWAFTTQHICQCLHLGLSSFQNCEKYIFVYRYNPKAFCFSSKHILRQGEGSLEDDSWLKIWDKKCGYWEREAFFVCWVYGWIHYVWGYFKWINISFTLGTGLLTMKEQEYDVFITSAKKIINLERVVFQIKMQSKENESCLKLVTMSC